MICYSVAIELDLHVALPARHIMKECLACRAS